MTKGDKIMVLIILFLSISLFLIINVKNIDSNSKYISVQINGEEFKQITFDNSSKTKIYPIETKFGKNVIEIKDEKVRVIEADCPDKIDVKWGYIKDVGEIIVCVPNRFVIEIKSDKDLLDLDAKVY